MDNLEAANILDESDVIEFVVAKAIEELSGKGEMSGKTEDD